MRSIQYRYPFTNLSIPNKTIVQIGFEFPQSEPITENFNSNRLFNFNNNTYLVTDSDILEYNDLDTIISNLSINTNNINDFKYTIIDILYEE